MTRDLITSGPATGADVMANLNSHIQRLWDASALPLTAIGGTANAITATLNPPLLGALVIGMKFSMTVATANTGPVTLSINGAAPVALLSNSGGALTAGALAANARIVLERAGTGGLRVIAGAREGATGGPARFVFTASGTWTVPTGYADETLVLLEAWGAGAGGGAATAGGGGGGGGYASRLIRYADLPASATVTIGAGGAVNAAGGNTTIGSLLTARGGGQGGNPSTGPGGGGGGGGVHSAGTSAGNANITAGTIGPQAAGGIGGGGAGGSGNGNMSGNGGAGSEGNLWGGGGGGGSGQGAGSVGGIGASAVYGGGGGGGVAFGSVGAGGLSLYGGNGGAANVAGSAPGGAGGRNAPGARGEARMTIFG
ncbi:MAG: hypothetical protein ACK4MS_10700 [Paracoccaceae bacterium]